MKYISNKKVRILALTLYDILIIVVAQYLSLLIRFDFKIISIPSKYLAAIDSYTLINIGVTILIFAIFHLYDSLWKYAGMLEFFNTIVACAVASASHLAGMTMMHLVVTRSYFLIYFFMLVSFTISGRFLQRLLFLFSNHFRMGKRKTPIITMVVGAGNAGALILKELEYSKHLNRKVPCVIDDNDNKKGTKLLGIPIVGNRNDIPHYVNKYKIEEIVIAIPTLQEKSKKDLLNICKNTGCKIKILPGTYQLIKGEVSVSKLRDVQIEDLLGRPAVKIKLDEVLSYVKDRVVLVTGGGGSIGSELCRQLANHEPKMLIIVDIYENNAYDIQQELINKYPDLELVVLIASVRDKHKIFTIFEKYKPDIIYHAAAHKHVPMMEISPHEAVKNNVFGTYNVVMAADYYKAKKFVLISTDKAVNPTNIMGATKRMCEMLIQAYQNKSSTEYVAVRFGNVLGSNGSVIPLFKRQISEGGPVTVTDRNIIRYFMTIPEAVTLVLEAGAYAKGGEIFVLDMGEPVKIDDLARNLIQLSGYRPDVDIKIEYVGLRPGEKLYEELLMQEENLKSTKNDRIYIGHPIEFDEMKFFQQLSELKDVVSEDLPGIKSAVSKIVKTYQVQNNN